MYEVYNVGNTEKLGKLFNEGNLERKLDANN